jgi:hypothetical protein
VDAEVIITSTRPVANAVGRSGTSICVGTAPTNAAIRPIIGL